MYKVRLITALAVGWLMASSVILAADAPAAPAKLESVSTTLDIHAPDFAPKPDDYRRQQEAASEVVVIRVTSVTTQAAATESNTKGALLVTAQAVIIGVSRSATKLANGDAIYLLYGYVPSSPGAPAPPPTPVLVKNTEYLAYLSKGSAKATYRPAAGAQSFLPANTPVVSTSGNGTAEILVKPATARADTSLLPTPDFPNPTGSVRLRTPAMEQIVKLVQVNGGWAVSIAQSDPVPLQTIGNAKPVLLVYYSPPLRSPVTQPAVLLYVAGTQPAEPPTKGTLTIERALVLDPEHHLLGDALWAKRVEDNQRPIPLPAWHWFEYKVDVEDIETHKVQTILLSSPSTPASLTSPPAASTDKKN